MNIPTGHQIDAAMATDSNTYETINNEGQSFRIRTKEFDDDQNMVLIVNNLGRSGSTWVGSLMSLVDNNTFYVYEPIQMLNMVLHEPITSYRSVEILSDVFRCQAQKSLTDLHSKWNFALFKAQANCGEKCQTINDYNDVCRHSSSVVVKVSPRLAISSLFELMCNCQIEA